MGADRTDVGRLSADDNVAAVRALPDAVAVTRGKLFQTAGNVE